MFCATASWQQGWARLRAARRRGEWSRTFPRCQRWIPSPADGAAAACEGRQGARRCFLSRRWMGWAVDPLLARRRAGLTTRGSAPRELSQVEDYYKLTTVVTWYNRVFLRHYSPRYPVPSSAA